MIIEKLLHSYYYECPQCTRIHPSQWGATKCCQDIQYDAKDIIKCPKKCPDEYDLSFRGLNCVVCGGTGFILKERFPNPRRLSFLRPRDHAEKK